MSDEQHTAGSGAPSGASLLRVSALILIVTGCVLVGAAYPASAVPSPGGTVTGGQTCTGWNVRVELNHKVAPFRTVEVFSDIPGHPGIVDGHFDSTFGLIWMASGIDNNITGTVTLRISAGTSPVFVASSSLIPAEGCAGATTSSTGYTSTSTTTTTLLPTATTVPGPMQGAARPPALPSAMPNTGPREWVPWLAVLGLVLIAVGVTLVRRARAR